jgi:hypothetical protein
LPVVATRRRTRDQGHQFRPVGAPDALNDRVRLTWRLDPPVDGDPIATGFDYGVVADERRFLMV